MNASPSGALAEYFERCQDRIDDALERLLRRAAAEDRLAAALAYAGLAKGKRLRPILVFASAQAVGANPDATLNAACAVELIHTYSLIHDDLPAMDDDDLRRGKPSLHKAFDDATAILAGDAMQALAFEVLSQPQEQLPASTQLQMIRTLAHAAGPEGMVAGQSMDCAASGQSLAENELEGTPQQLATAQQRLEDMHQHKTGALISASVKLGALCAKDVSAERLAALESFASHIGLAFQVRDDILDVEGDPAALGKPLGSDDRSDKITYVSLLGLGAARTRAVELADAARASLQPFSSAADNLREIASYIVAREH